MPPEAARNIRKNRAPLATAMENDRGIPSAEGFQKFQRRLRWEQSGEASADAKRNLPASPASSTVIVLPGNQSEQKPVVLSKNQKTGNLRFALITELNKRAEMEGGPRVETVTRLLRLYNDGLLFPGIYKDLGSISPRTFYRYLEKFNEGGIDGLATQYGNGCRRAFSGITEVEKEYLKPLLNQNKRKIADVIRKGKWICGEGSPSSVATLYRYINRFRSEYHDVWTLEREGQKAWNDKCAPHLDRAWWTLKTGEWLVGDGHRFNFQVVNPHTGKPSRPTLVLFWDWYSSFPVGWEVMLTENVQCVAAALRNSILTLGKVPKYVYLDNGKAFKAKCFTESIVLEQSEIPGMFDRLGIEIVWATPYNAQAKPVERIFGPIEWLEREMKSYCGRSVDDKPAGMRPNEDRARKLRGDRIPTIEEVNQSMHRWQNFYAEQPLRGRKNHTAKELFESGKGPGIDPKRLSFLMMKDEVKTVRRCRLTFDGFDWTGDCLYGIKSRVIVRYSLSDFGQLYVFDLKDQFIGIVKPVEFTAPRDYEAAKRIVSERRRLLRQTKALSNMAKQASPGTIDLISRKNPELLEYIEAEEAKKPENKRISPFLDEPIEAEVSASHTEENKIDMAADHGSPLSCPWLEEDFEMYDWFYLQDPEKLNFADLGWIDWYEDSYMGRYFKPEMGQGADLRFLLCKRLGKSYYDEDPALNREDYRLGRDPAIVSRWQGMRDALAANPDLGPCRPVGDPESFDELKEYELYRGVEKRFPGTLNEAQWRRVEEYQATREWERLFKEYEIRHMSRPRGGDLG